jgi:tRNA threonylcarbamoyladenosine biosynthesis protein TsaB
VLASAEERMDRGHQERIAPMVQQVMAQAGLAFGDLVRIGVTVGPGSFTGLRVAISFARTMALALGIECVGFTSLAALNASQSLSGLSVVAIPSRQGQAYVEFFNDEVSVSAPALLDESDVSVRLADVWQGGPLNWVGLGAAALAILAQGKVWPRQWPSAEALLALTLQAQGTAVRPRPLYLRAPDARTIAERLAGG